jgi:hypothetical protein
MCYHSANLEGIDQWIQVFKGMHLVDVCKQLNIEFDKSKPLIFYGSKYTLIVGHRGNKYTKVPSLIDKAVSLGTAIVVSVDHIISGRKPTVDEPTRARRLATCKSCPYYRNGKCKICGCITKYKIKLLASYCPEGHW